MRNVRQARHGLAHTQKLTIVAQDPSVKVGGKILVTEVEVPAEELLAGPRGYRVNVIDYDASTNVLYKPEILQRAGNGQHKDRFALRLNRAGQRIRPKNYDSRLLSDPRFHAQNVFAIVMRTLARFEFALGRRVSWGSQGHQIHVAPHAFADANAFYSRDDRAIFFGYFAAGGRPVFTCLSHDIVAHETTHALLDGLRARYLEPSSPDQAAFHEGFADIVALLSIFSLRDVVGCLLDKTAKPGKLISKAHLTRDALKESVLLGLADEMGSAMSGIRGEALRRSVKLPPGRPYMSMKEFEEEHDRGELLVAAFMNAFIDIWMARLEKIGFISPGKRDRSLVVDEGARVAGHLLTIAIRAIDYCPPVDISFTDYLSALLTIDREVVPDDQEYSYRRHLLKNFRDYDIAPDSDAGDDGAWMRCDQELIYSRTHFDSLLTNREEVFRFLWENRKALKLHPDAYIEVQSVRPCIRVGPDGFTLRETVAEYVQIMTLRASELKTALDIVPPKDFPEWKRVRIYGGGALIFDEYGQLKYQIANRIEDAKRQTRRLKYLWESGYFDDEMDAKSRFATLHRARAKDRNHTMGR